jgi:hypothetical protein
MGAVASRALGERVMVLPLQLQLPPPLALPLLGLLEERACLAPRRQKAGARIRRR